MDELITQILDVLSDASPDRIGTENLRRELNRTLARPVGRKELTSALHYLAGLKKITRRRFGSHGWAYGIKTV